jgi:non-specific serine/threonine protein kinase
LEEGGFAEARAAAEEGLALATKERWPMGMALLQSLLGAVSCEEGDSAAARTLLEAGLALRRASGDRGQPLARNLVYLARIVLDEGDHATACALYAESVLLNREVGDPRGLAEALEGCACVAVAEHRPAQALRLAGAAGHLRAGIGAHLSPTGRRAIENWLGQARRSLGNRAADAAWAAGKRLTADQAVAEAMAVGNADTPQPSPLTSRERELVGLLTQGRTDRQIARALVISERTAHAHIRNILAKLGLQNRVQIAAWAVHDGWPAEPADGPRSR